MFQFILEKRGMFYVGGFCVWSENRAQAVRFGKYDARSAKRLMHDSTSISIVGDNDTPT